MFDDEQIYLQKTNDKQPDAEPKTDDEPKKSKPMRPADIEYWQNLKK